MDFSRSQLRDTKHLKIIIVTLFSLIYIFIKAGTFKPIYCDIHYLPVFSMFLELLSTILHIFFSISLNLHKCTLRYRPLPYFSFFSILCYLRAVISCNFSHRRTIPLLAFSASSICCRNSIVSDLPICWNLWPQGRTNAINSKLFQL